MKSICFIELYRKLWEKAIWEINMGRTIQKKLARKEHI